MRLWLRENIEILRSIVLRIKPETRLLVTVTVLLGLYQGGDAFLANLVTAMAMVYCDLRLR